MKRIIAVVALAVALVFVVSAAASTSSLSGSAKWNNHLVLNFSTTVPGDVTVTADFTPKPNGLYKIDAQSLSGTIVGCQVLANTSPLSCTMSAAPASDYTMQFWPVKGPAVVATLTATGP